MCITGGEAQRNLRIGTLQPDTKIRGRRRFAETPQCRGERFFVSTTYTKVS
ncbi:MAG: hypothetical protein LBU34_17950 [Planctomycetaceae bacterium]|nr:hypothetical protein [Planctomycetaceae bacterium]